jgi:hypothetical protein
VAPADQALVLAPPGGALVLGPGDEPGRAPLGDRELRRRLGLAGDEHELAADVFARIVGGGAPGADVDQLRLGPAADAVPGEGDRLVCPGGDSLGIAPSAAVLLLLPKLGEAGIPGRTRSLGAVEDPAVRRQREDVDLLQAIVAKPVADRLRRLPIAFRASHPVVEGEGLDGALGGSAGKLGGQGFRLGGGE